MRYLSALVLVALLFALPSCKFLKSKGLFGKEDNSLALLQAKQDSIRGADSIMRVQERLMALENAKLDSLRRVEEERLAWESKFKYNIIVGSFITPEYAKLVAEEYRNLGYNSRILKMEGSRFELVSAEVHASFNEALARLKGFQDTIDIDSWMYIVR
jgi:hypothetical protein